MAEVAARYHVPWYGTDFRTLLAAPGVDAVVICTPNALHVPQAQAALMAGKHVLVQKPLALTWAEAQATVDLAAQVGRLLFVDYTYRYLATVDRLRQSLLEIGRPRQISAAFHNVYGPGKAWFFDPRLSGGGALIDLGVHLIDLALDLLSPSAVSLEELDLSFSRGHPVEDAARLIVLLDEVPFSLEVSWNADRPLTEIGLEIEAEQGRVRWENVEGSFFRFRTMRDSVCLLDRETTLRADTLAAFCRAVADQVAPPVHLTVYELLTEAYSSSGRRR